MRAHPLAAPAFLLVLGGASPAQRPSEPALAGGAAERVVPNDNRQPAGTMRGNTLVLHLEARVATWHPDADSAPGAPVPAFAEEGGVARIPGPLVRVPAGTEVDVSVKNTLADTLRVHGLHARTGNGPVDASPIVLAPGERRSVRFRLDAAGTYFYWGTTTRRILDFRTLADAQLTGVIVVDDPSASPAAQRPRDRIFVIGMWTDTVARARTNRQRVLAVINGRSWPHTERISATVGDTVRWRVINASADLHPMHLHGFYFRIDSRGDGRGDTLYAAGSRGMAVTESLGIAATMSLTWVPERAGNWLFHCHIPEHFGPRGPLGMPRATSAGDHADHATSGMNGLVLGVTVRPAPIVGSEGRSAGMGAGNAERRMRLLVRENRGGTAAIPFYGYALHEGGAEPPPDSGVVAGPTLDLVRGQPVRITVVNRLPEPTAVHWHGIELESYYDGVPGFSGAGQRVTPLIAPRDSFVVRFTPPRAGTFIYHTHAVEERQALAGLAGPIVVREPGTVRDPVRDIPILLTEAADSNGRPEHTLVNGRRFPMPIEMKAGTTYRLRFVQMSVTRAAMRMELFRDSSFMEWRPVAKDGAEIPVANRRLLPSRIRLGIGETMDVEFTPGAAGDHRLVLGVGLRWPAPIVYLTTVPIHVVPAR